MIRLRPSGADEVLIKRVQDWYEPGPGVFIASTAGQTASFTPASLFTGSTTGVWYDPSDLTTLFQDAAGTTPVTAVEQPVGLMLDKSKGLVLGPELVTNGDFSNGTAGWSAGGGALLSVVSGKLRITQPSSTGVWAYQALTTVVGRRYWVSLNFESISGSTFAVFVSTTIGGTETYLATPGSVASYTFSFVATATTHYINVQPWTPAVGREAYFDNISVRELPGNHAFNSSGNSANFPVLSARYNLLTKTEDFSSGAWNVKSNLTITADAATAPNGTLTADRVNIANSASLQKLIGRGVSEGAPATVSLSFRAGTGIQYVQILRDGSGNYANFDILNGVAGTTSGAGVTSSISSQGDGWYRCTLVCPGSTSTVLYIGAVGSNSAMFGEATTAVGDYYIWGADLRVANDALNQPAYQRVNTSSDYDTVGFKPYLKFNGTNQWLQTNSIDFTYGDKMFVCAGVRKLSDYTGEAAGATIAEFSSSVGANNGSWALTGSIGYSSNRKYSVQSKGTLPYVETYTTNASYAAPVTNIVSSISNINGSPSDYVRLKVNGTQVAETTTDQGAGPYGNYPLYIGARAGSSAWFNGRLHQLVVAGKQASADEITNTETFINQKTGAY